MSLDAPDWQRAVVSPGGSPLTGDTGQVNVGTVATLIVAANAKRTGLTISNPAANSSPVYIGNDSVSTSTGYILYPGHDITVAAQQTWYGIVAVGSVLVSYEDE